MSPTTRNLRETSVQGNILIVDDYMDNLHLLRELLQTRGHVVRCVRDGQSAFVTIKAKLPDVVLLDIRLPDVDGYKICEILRENADTHHLPIIFLSALDRPEDRIRGFEAGGDDYINKPFNENEVIARVESKLLQAQLLRQQHELNLQADRQRIARDLHDSLQQSLYVLGATARGLVDDRSISQQMREHLVYITELSESAVAELRLLLFELRPEKLSKTRLQKLLGRLVESNRNRSEAKLDLIADSAPLRLPPDVHLAFYRIAQEALHNAIVHAEAQQITLNLQHDDEHVILRVMDDGVGFDTNDLDDVGNGLENMQTRAADLQLQMSIKSVIGTGTEIKLEWQRNSSI